MNILAASIGRPTCMITRLNITIAHCGYEIPSHSALYAGRVMSKHLGSRTLHLSQ